jgi:hypothetical protein
MVCVKASSTSSKRASRSLLKAVSDPSNFNRDTGLEIAEMIRNLVVWDTVRRQSFSRTSVVVDLKTEPFNLSLSLATAFQLLEMLESPQTSKTTIVKIKIKL